MESAVSSQPSARGSWVARTLDQLDGVIPQELTVDADLQIRARLLVVFALILMANALVFATSYAVLGDWWSALDPLGDHDLVAFHSTMVDAFGNPTFLPWMATEMQVASLSPLYPRTNTLFVPIGADTRGPVHVEAHLRFRQVAPFVLRAVGMDDKIDDLIVWDVASATTDIDVLR